MIDYQKEAEKYQPKKIKTLLVGEAPPAGGNNYFYVPRDMNGNKPAKKDANLPITIFHHYFRRKRPIKKSEYIRLLKKLQRKGIFLIDIIDEPIRVRGNPLGIARVRREIRKLKDKMKRRKISVKEKNIIFLAARGNYISAIRREFPYSEVFRWIDFRMCH